MKFLAFFCSFTFAFISYSQESFINYYYQDGKKAPKDSAYYYETGTKIDKRYSGQRNQYYSSNDTLKNTVFYDDKGMQGLRQLFYESGQIKLKEYYIDHQRIGKYEVWYANGQQDEEREYLNVPRDFDRTREFNYRVLNKWDSTGKQNVVNGNGYYIRDKKSEINTDDHFDILSEDNYAHIEGEIKKGKRVGQWNGLRHNGSTFIEKYKKGKLIEGIATTVGGDQIQYDQTSFQPVPNRGYEGFYKYVGKTIRYPEKARRFGIEGRVFVQFIVDKDGKLIDVKTIKGISDECDREAERTIANSKPWRPGLLRGEPVKVRFILPLTFKLN